MGVFEYARVCAHRTAFPGILEKKISKLSLIILSLINLFSTFLFNANVEDRVVNSVTREKEENFSANFHF